MTFYQQQVLKHQQHLYSKDYLLQRVITAKKFVDNNYLEDISLRQVAMAACLSRFHFIRSFKMYYGITPNQYLTHKKIELAKMLITQGHAIKEVRLLIGFSSPTTFIALFKKHTGHTPQFYSRKAI